jgi:hypothetical protein
MPIWSRKMEMCFFVVMWFLVFDLFFCECHLSQSMQLSLFCKCLFRIRVFWSWVLFPITKLTWLLPHCVVVIVRLGFIWVPNEQFCISSCKSWLEWWSPCNWLYESRKSLYFGLVICCRNMIPCVQGFNLATFMGLALASVFGIV